MKSERERSETRLLGLKFNILTGAVIKVLTWLRQQWKLAPSFNHLSSKYLESYLVFYCSSVHNGGDLYLLGNNLQDMEKHSLNLLPYYVYRCSDHVTTFLGSVWRIGVVFIFFLFFFFSNSMRKSPVLTERLHTAHALCYFSNKRQHLFA